jgi:hypothetical protein
MFGNLAAIVKEAYIIADNWDKPETQRAISELQTRIKADGARQSTIEAINDIGIIAQAICDMAFEAGIDPSSL